MTSVFESIKQGMSEAIDYERGNLPCVKVDRVVVAPLNSYAPGTIKDIRARHSMTQRLFAEAMGVSVKTVEAWESGTNAPSGVASRMLGLLERDSSLFERHGIVERQLAGTI